MPLVRLIPIELIHNLYEARAITLTPSYETDKEIQIKVALQDIICLDPIVRRAVARMFNRALRKRFPDHEEDQKRLHPEIKRVMEYRYGFIGTLAIGAIMGLLPCPIGTIKIGPDEKPEIDFHGRLVTDYPYVLMDDLIKTGKTLSKELEFLLDHNFKIDTIIVFYDEGIGGQERIRIEYKKLSRFYFGKEQKIKIEVLMPRERIISLLKEAKIIVSRTNK
ncbi:MAG: hypothetical protein Q8L47_04370 [bacterium]|nr:hypothetical protein [bacterium]